MRSSSSSSSIPARMDVRLLSPTRPTPSIGAYRLGMDMLVFAEVLDEGGPVGGGEADELAAGGMLLRRAETLESPVATVVAIVVAVADGLSGLLSYAVTKLLLSSSTESRRRVEFACVVLARSVLVLAAPVPFLALFRADPVSTWSARLLWASATTTEDDIDADDDADDDVAVDSEERVVWWNGRLVLVVVDKEVGYL